MAVSLEQFHRFTQQAFASLDATTVQEQLTAADTMISTTRFKGTKRDRIVYAKAAAELEALRPGRGPGAVSFTSNGVTASFAGPGVSSYSELYKRLIGPGATVIT